MAEGPAGLHFAWASFTNPILQLERGSTILPLLNRAILLTANETYLWVLIGAAVGWLAVYVSITWFGLALESWMAALVPTFFAIVFGGAAPRMRPVPEPKYGEEA